MDLDALTAAVEVRLAGDGDPAKRFQAAADLLARLVGEGQVAPGQTFRLEAVDQSQPDKPRAYLHVWGLNDQTPNKGYFGVLSSAGGVRLYRVIRFNDTAVYEKDTGWSGGNDYALIDAFQSQVVR